MLVAYDQTEKGGFCGPTEEAREGVGVFTVTTPQNPPVIPPLRVQTTHPHHH